MLPSPVCCVQQSFLAHIIYMHKSFSISVRRDCTWYHSSHKIHNKAEKTGQTNTSLQNTQAQMHALSCSEDEAQDSLQVYTQVFNHGGREILWFTKLHTRPTRSVENRDLRTPCRLHLPSYIALRIFVLALSSCCCLSGQTFHSTQSISTALWSTHTSSETRPGV